MEKGYVKIYCGDGKGKSTASLGRALVCASEGKNVFVVQFLKGRLTGELDFFNQLEPELKIFRFEKEEGYYENLSEQEKKEENQNIINGLNFVRKVLTIGECDVLVLDEILGLVDLEIISVEDIIKLIEMKDDTVELILTGRNLPEKVAAYADYISEINILKDEISHNS
ncbi:MAG: cob(I)yrinic acid a,c-diamide adenosyltransferase [Clostridiales bacterium]|nr:cob(I)yrinic acid a,c-diamide adenosyltransferase [Clostridiales bacterium]MDY3747762.1 cob(I)yrinic acid a,c-diamide adenosyltransferase [Lachnospiraceae bacterium]